MNTSSVINSPFAWLVRRELWEHRLAWVPVLLGLVISAGAVLSFLNSSHMMFNVDLSGDDSRSLANATPEQLRILLACGLAGVTALFLALANGLQFFYAADALYSERSQRTILFWKSLPVGDLSTVLAKVFVAMIVMPLIAVAAALGTELVLAIVVSIQFRHYPQLLEVLWNPGVWLNSLVIALYVLVTASLWFLPIIAWMLFVSAWIPISRARLGRSPMLVAVLIPTALMIGEYIVLRTQYVKHVVLGRLLFLGYPQAAFDLKGNLELSDTNRGKTMASMMGEVLSPGHFLASPALWAGLAVSALLLAGAVYCRRQSENRA